MHFGWNIGKAFGKPRLLDSYIYKESIRSHSP